MNAIQRRKLQMKPGRPASGTSANHPPPPPVIKGHQECSDLTRSGQDNSDQEDPMNVLRNALERRKLLIRARRASGGADHLAPPPPIQNLPSPPPAAPAHREWTKRQPIRPPPASSGTNTSTSTSTKPPAFKKPPSIVCRVCGVRCMTVSHLKQHEKGRKHRNKVAYAAGEMNVRCDVCDVPLLTMANIQEHYAGKQHLHRVFGSGSGASYVALPPATQ